MIKRDPLTHVYDDATGTWRPRKSEVVTNTVPLAALLDAERALREANVPPLKCNGTCGRSFYVRLLRGTRLPDDADRFVCDECRRTSR